MLLHAFSNNLTEAEEASRMVYSATHPEWQTMLNDTQQHTHILSLSNLVGGKLTECLFYFNVFLMPSKIIFN